MSCPEFLAHVRISHSGTSALIKALLFPCLPLLKIEEIRSAPLGFIASGEAHVLAVVSGVNTVSRLAKTQPCCGVALWQAICGHFVS